jgi:hypothetical protein
MKALARLGEIEMRPTTDCPEEEERQNTGQMKDPDF